MLSPNLNNNADKPQKSEYLQKNNNFTHSNVVSYSSLPEHLHRTTATNFPRRAIESISETSKYYGHAMATSVAHDFTRHFRENIFHVTTSSPLNESTTVEHSSTTSFSSQTRGDSRDSNVLWPSHKTKHAIQNNDNTHGKETYATFDYMKEIDNLYEQAMVINKEKHMRDKENQTEEERNQRHHEIAETLHKLAMQRPST